ncbi:MAG: RuvX/YqgF family protein [Candidatus Dojkabacteria bacterium]|nr:RuvX/YqgF family protein [Candidatus Dojkabacteria bacterium]
MILAIDFGLRNVGFAISDPTNKFAIPVRPLVLNYNDRFDVITIFTKIYDRILEYKPGKVIIGYPKHRSPKNKSIRLLIFELQNFLKAKGISCILWDETLTSRIQEVSSNITKNYKKYTSTDSQAARIIAQEYLDFINSNK